MDRNKVAELLLQRQQKRTRSKDAFLGQLLCKQALEGYSSDPGMYIAVPMAGALGGAAMHGENNRLRGAVAGGMGGAGAYLGHHLATDPYWTGGQTPTLLGKALLTGGFGAGGYGLGRMLADTLGLKAQKKPKKEPGKALQDSGEDVRVYIEKLPTPVGFDDRRLRRAL